MITTWIVANFSSLKHEKEGFLDWIMAINRGFVNIKKNTISKCFEPWSHVVSQTGPWDTLLKCSEQAKQEWFTFESSLQAIYETA